MRLFPILVAVLSSGLPAAAQTTDLVFTPISPCRVIDTRLSTSPPTGLLAAGTPYTFFFRDTGSGYASQGGSAGSCGIPGLGGSGANMANQALAVAINLVAVSPAGAGDLEGWAAGQTIPKASVLNYAQVSHLNLANGVILPMCSEVSSNPCPNGDITFEAQLSGIELVADVTGYFHVPAPLQVSLNTGEVTGVLPVSNGGTGANSLTGVLKGNGTGPVTALNGTASAVAMWTDANSLGSGPLSFPLSSGARVESGLWLGGLSYGADLDFPTGVVAFNAFRDSNTGHWTTLGDSVNNGGAAVFAGPNGVLYFATIASTGPTDATHTDLQVFAEALNWINPNGTVTGFSDARLKKDVVTLDGALERVLQMRAVHYRWKNSRPDDPVLLGLIAQEVEEIFPEVVSERPDGMKGIDYSRLVVPLIAALQELEAARLSDASRYTTLAQRVEAIESQLATKVEPPSPTPRP